MTARPSLADLGPVAQLRAGRLPRRLTQLYAGLVLYGASLALMVRGELGLAPWDVLHSGFIRHVPITLGQAVILISVVVLLLWVPLREKPGLGTVSNAIVVGLAADATLAVLAAPEHLSLRIALMLAGVVLNGLATAMYIGAQLGRGPRDGLMTGLSRVTGRSLRLVRTGLEVGVVLVGLLLGGALGVGTVLYAVLIGPLAQVMLPAWVVHVGSGRHLTIGERAVVPGRTVGPRGHDGDVPLDAELADLRGFLVSRGVDHPPERLAETFRSRGSRLTAGDDVVLARSGVVGADGVVADDALLLVRPTPRPDTALRLLALDVETTGLVPGRDRVVSVGWVPVDGDRLDLAGARRFVVRGDDPGGAAEIHGLTHDDLAAGTPLPEVLRALRAALGERALLAHHATFDLGFLRAAFREAGERMPRVPVVCTLSLHKRLLRADALAEWPAGALRLWTARERYGLPPGRPHDALGDALACAELYLGQAAELGRGRELTLRDLRMPTGWRHRTRRWLRRRWWRARRRWGRQRDR